MSGDRPPWPLNTGHVATILRSRGVPYGSTEVIRQVLRGVSPDRAAQLANALAAAEKGVEDTGQTALLAALACASRASTQEAIEASGAPMDPVRLFEWIATDHDANRVLERARAADTAARETLVRVFQKAPEGTSGHAPRERAQPPALNPPEAVPRGEDALADPGPSPPQAPHRKHYVRATKGCLMFELDEVRDADDQGRRNTVRLEGAARASAGTGFDWTSKLIFQFTLKELPVLAAAALGLVPAVKFTGHGREQDKWCSLELQRGRLFVKVGQGTRTIAVPIQGGDLYSVALVCQRALALNDPDLPPYTLLQTLQLTGALMHEPGGEKQADRGARDSGT